MLIVRYAEVEKIPEIFDHFFNNSGQTAHYFLVTSEKLTSKGNLHFSATTYSLTYQRNPNGAGDGKLLVNVKKRYVEIFSVMYGLTISSVPCSVLYAVQLVNGVRVVVVAAVQDAAAAAGPASRVHSLSLSMARMINHHCLNADILRHGLNGPLFESGKNYSKKD